MIRRYSENKNGHSPNTTRRQRYGRAGRLRHNGKGLTGLHCMADIVNEELNTGPAVQLVKGGVWQVPPGRRPVGWERMVVREP